LLYLSTQTSMIVLETTVSLIYINIGTLCRALLKTIQDPVAAAIKYETLVFQVNKTFMSMKGIPSIETDEAWTEMQERKLFSPLTIFVCGLRESSL
jgi:hypothetical protein